MEEIQVIVEEVRMKLLGVKPQAFQALWYSDWDYLSLDFEVVTKNDEKYTSQTLKEIRPYFETEIKGGEVQLPKESRVALTLGNMLSEEYQVPFYFPSPKTWDSDCPNWWEQEKSVKCADCGKPFNLSDSPYISKEVCSDCERIRRENENVKKNELYNEGIFTFLFKEGTYKCLGFCSEVAYSPIASFYKNKISEDITGKIIHIVSINKIEMIDFSNFLVTKIKGLLSGYVKPNVAKKDKKFKTNQTENKQFEDIEYELFTSSEVYSLICNYDTTKNAIDENWSYKFYLMPGIRYRDNAFLRYIHFLRKGITNIEQLESFFGSTLSRSEIQETLLNLLQNDCITINNGEIEIAMNGRNIIWSYI